VNFRFPFAQLTLMLGSRTQQSRRRRAGGQDRRNQRRDEPKRKIALGDDERPAPMSPEEERERDERLLKVVERGGYSTCFWWFYDPYENMCTADGNLRMTWRDCTASLTAIGVTAMRGRPLTPETTRKTWWKVVERKRRDAARGYQSPYSEAERGTTH
jgi:hypothetical protein